MTTKFVTHSVLGIISPPPLRERASELLFGVVRISPLQFATNIDFFHSKYTFQITLLYKQNKLKNTRHFLVFFTLLL